MSLSTIQTLQVIILAASFTAMFFATFQLLPYAQAIYTAAMIAWTLAALALIYTLAEHFLNGTLTKFTAALRIFSLV
ncbi:MAG: hypothetical protein EAX81_03655 [Candidatus Thorarchaeota archaeon]|nr:hypothetical protein [Candidatus Thorarchaeota archaeon]